MRDLFLGLDLSASDIALLFFFIIPNFLIIVLPVSCMVSVFLSFLRMGTDRELIALKAGGISIYQMLCAPVIFSALCMCGAVFLSLHATAWGMGNFRSTLLHIANTRAKLEVQPGVFNRDIFGLTLFARKVDPVTGKLQQVIFEDATHDKKISITVLAPEGSIITDEERGELVFHLENGRLYRVDNENVSILEFVEYSVRLNLSSLFSGMDIGDVSPKEMGWRDLVAMEKKQNAPNERFQRRVAVEIQKRWALPAACLILGVFALPLACAFEGIKRQMGTVLALAMFLFYYSLFSIGLTTGESGLLPPWLGLWAANVFFALASVAGIYMTNRERVPAATRAVFALKRGLLRLLPATRKEGE